MDKYGLDVRWAQFCIEPESPQRKASEWWARCGIRRPARFSFSSSCPALRAFTGRDAVPLSKPAFWHQPGTYKG